MLPIPLPATVCLSTPSFVDFVLNSCTALAANNDTNTRAIFVLAAQKPPYNVYGNPFYDYAGYGNVFSVKDDGALKENCQNYEYEPKTGIHGMVFDPTETYLYSADLRANKIWTHKKDAQTGQLTLVGSLDAPDPGDHPRWVEMHPSGNYLYALMEAGNNVAEYVIDPQTHLPVFTHRTWPLIPPGMLNATANLGRSSQAQVSSTTSKTIAATWSSSRKAATRCLRQPAPTR